MTSQLTRKRPPRQFRLLVIFVLVLGIVFRFTNLDQKVYSFDEVRSFIRLSGYRVEAEFVEQVYDGDIITVAELQKYQRPNSEKNLNDAIAALKDNPEHPPLYYLMARFWMQLFNAPVAARVLSALLGLLIFPGIYWLCLELFEAPITGWTAMMLIAVSPLHIYLAQEARQYSLWTAVTAVSSAALLRSLRLKTAFSWGSYAVTIALGLYTHLFFVWVIIAQTIYVIITEFRANKKIAIADLLSCLIGGIIFIPWAVVIVRNLERVEENTRWARDYRDTLKAMTGFWLDNLTSVFVYFPATPSLNNPLNYLILILVIYSLYFLYRYGDRRAWLFILTLIGITALTQVLPDLILGGRRSILPRYLVPCYLGIELAIAYLFSRKIDNINLTSLHRKFWQVTLVILISAGAISGQILTKTRALSLGEASAINLQIAPFINESQNPLVISDTRYTFFLPLSYLLKPQIQFQIVARKDLDRLKHKIKIPRDGVENEFSDVFLYFPSKELLEYVTENSNSQPTVVVGILKTYSSHRNWLYRLE